jgi:hypothetical protein
MPFGICNAPATFRLRESVLTGLAYNACLVYHDDVIVNGRTFQGQLNNLRKVFRRLLEAHFKLNPEKCQLFRKEVRYLGHIVSQSGVTTDSEKLEPVKNWPIHTDKHQLKSFLGLCAYYRRFISAFADIAKPLTRLRETGIRMAYRNRDHFPITERGIVHSTSYATNDQGSSSSTPTPVTWGLVQDCPKYKTTAKGW